MEMLYQLSYNGPRLERTVFCLNSGIAPLPLIKDMLLRGSAGAFGVGGKPVTFSLPCPATLFLFFNVGGVPPTAGEVLYQLSYVGLRDTESPTTANSLTYKLNFINALPKLVQTLIIFGQKTELIIPSFGLLIIPDGQGAFQSQFAELGGFWL